LALWLSALKIIPWGDVIEAAPAIVKKARAFFARTQGADAVAQTTQPDEVAGNDDQAQLRLRVQQLEAQVAQIVAQQQASAAIIESLAEHNAKVVQAIDVLRIRTRVLLWVSGGLLIAVLALAGWVGR
jgi:hypothetical protein